MPLLFTKSELEMQALSQGEKWDLAGGYVSFFGHVRAINNQKNVKHLIYEAYTELAQRMFCALEDEAKTRFGILSCTAVHRLGQVSVGQRAVAILVCTPHRHEAFLAARFLIDELKKMLPIWKKEVYADGTSTWDKGTCLCATQSHDDQLFSSVEPALRAKKTSREELAQKRALLVGAGGLGCPLALNIVALGVKQLVVYDADVVNAKNLARQFMFEAVDIGKNKASAIKAFLQARFIDAKIDACQENLNYESAQKIIGDFDVVIDASDCRATKKMLAKLAYIKSVPFVCASVYQLEGEVQAFWPKAKGCLQCYTHGDGQSIKNCAEIGVLTHVCSMVASVAAHRVLHVLAGQASPHQQLFLVEPEVNKILEMKIFEDPNCSVCAGACDAESWR